MTDLPEPLTPSDCDLRDFGFMPLDVVRLRDSDLAALPDAEAFRAAVISWCVAWHQSPAASLPDDDAALCRLLGYGRDMKGWLRVRAAGALRGYVRCNDGRLYHPVVSQKARDAWEAKQKQRARTAAARAARQSQKDGTSDTGGGTPSSQTPSGSVTDNVTGSKGQGQGQGQGERGSDEPLPPSPRKRGKPPPPLTQAEIEDAFTTFWVNYPRSDKRREARIAFERALPKVAWNPVALIEGLLTRLSRFDTRENGRFVPLAASWLNGERWTDGERVPGKSTPELPLR